MGNKIKLKTVILLLISVIVSGGIGLMTGFHFGIRSGNMLSSTLEYQFFREPILVVLSQGNCQAVKEALKKHISLVNKYKDIPESFFFGSVGSADLILSHTRLARLEQKDGNISIAQEHLKKAKDACNKLEWEDCSEDNMIMISKLFEEKSPIPCLKK